MRDGDAIGPASSTEMSNFVSNIVSFVIEREKFQAHFNWTFALFDIGINSKINRVLTIVMCRLFRMTLGKSLRYRYFEATLLVMCGAAMNVCRWRSLYHYLPFALSVTQHNTYLYTLLCVSFFPTYCGSINMMPLIICAYRHVLCM